MSVNAIDLQYSPNALCVDVLKGKVGARKAQGGNTLDQWAAYDPYDYHGKHIVVTNADGKNVASARYLDEISAAEIGNFSLQNQFDITPLKSMIGRMAEVSIVSISPHVNPENTCDVLMNQVFALAARGSIDSILVTVTLAIDESGRGTALPEIKPHLVRDYMRCFPKGAARKSVSTLCHSSAEADLIDFLIHQYSAKFCSKPHWHHLDQKLEYCLLVPVSKPVI